MWKISLFLLFIPLLVTAVVSWWRARAKKLTCERELRVGVTGSELAQKLLAYAKLDMMQIEMRPGLRAGMSIQGKKIGIRPQVWGARDVFSLGEVVHEVGHVLQAAQGDKGILARLALRRWLEMAPLLCFILALVVVVRFQNPHLAMAFFAVSWALALLSNLSALPLELDASRRGRQLAVQAGLVKGEDELIALRTAASAAAVREFSGLIVAMRTVLDSLRMEKTER